MYGNLQVKDQGWGNRKGVVYVRPLPLRVAEETPGSRFEGKTNVDVDDGGDGEGHELERRMLGDEASSV
eukprot:CAMPEP_0118661016 /NCGR_PEP_ID=MMETSP0785-20121206/16030_1 /TAXON_ID=91992 /ORGANISM="Bolidomonas pacifica, Strain CCMP 1866" /LENGTH=68 /DNA_ID=CAMNT_0006554379 /DNA_START=590 /DNA_END=793 /DNA_ORIENTATION=+